MKNTCFPFLISFHLILCVVCSQDVTAQRSIYFGTWEYDLSYAKQYILYEDLIPIVYYEQFYSEWLRNRGFKRVEVSAYPSKRRVSTDIIKDGYVIKSYYFNGQGASDTSHVCIYNYKQNNLLIEAHVNDRKLKQIFSIHYHFDSQKRIKAIDTIMDNKVLHTEYRYGNTGLVNYFNHNNKVSELTYQMIEANEEKVVNEEAKVHHSLSYILEDKLFYDKETSLKIMVRGREELLHKIVYNKFPYTYYDLHYENKVNKYRKSNYIRICSPQNNLFTTITLYKYNSFCSHIDFVSSVVSNMYVQNKFSNQVLLSKVCNETTLKEIKYPYKRTNKRIILNGYIHKYF